METQYERIELRRKPHSANGLGQAQAFRKLHLATSSIVYGYALSILKNSADAEDVMHDAYIRAFNGAAAYQSRGKPLAWLLTIARNLSYNKVRSGKPTVDMMAWTMTRASGARTMAMMLTTNS